MARRKVVLQLLLFLGYTHLGSPFVVPKISSNDQRVATAHADRKYPKILVRLQLHDSYSEEGKGITSTAYVDSDEDDKQRLGVGDCVGFEKKKKKKRS